MRVSIDSDAAGVPRRGDILQTNLGDRRERTFLVLKVHRLRPMDGVPRYSVWAERWWEIEPDTRKRLFESAERSGGQHVIRFVRCTAKTEKRTFEDLLRNTGP